MFKLHGVSLLQPEQLISERLPGGAEALGALLTDVQTGLEALYAGADAQGARSLCLALAPNGQFELWLSSEDDAASTDEQARVKNLATRLSAPPVVGGPVALALVFSVGSESPAEAQLTLPDEWRAVIQASDEPLNVEQIITRLWAITN